jgi:hypothetical protein
MHRIQIRVRKTKPIAPREPDLRTPSGRPMPY